MDRKKYLTKFTPEDERIVDLFIEEMNKIHNLYLKAISSNDLSKANKLLKQLKNISNTLKSEYGKRAEKRIPEEYLKGSKYINDIAGIEDGFSLGLPQSREQIEALLNEAGPIHVEAVQALLNSSLNYVRSSLDGMERQAISLVNEFQQEKIREELAKGMISGEGIHKMNQRIEKYFQSEKLTGFRDKAGRFWSMERYIDMLTRTETAIANIQGTINRGIQIGITKFKIYEHPDCCEECAELDGNIVDISEGVVELPPFHPNCRGYIVAIVDEEEWNNRVIQTEVDNIQTNNINTESDDTDNFRLTKEMKDNWDVAHSMEYIDKKIENDARIREMGYDNAVVASAYSGGLFEEWNRSLRRGEQKGFLPEFTNQFEKIINKYGTEFEDSVFRGTNIPEEVFLDMKDNMAYSDEAFTSFSKSLAVAEDFIKNPRDDPSKVPVLFEIKGGGKGLDMEGIAMHGEEHEVVMNKGVEFEVINIYEEMGFYNEKHYRVVLKQFNYKKE